MPAPPSRSGLNFGQSESGLFSPEEIRHLMEVEFRRAERYGFPLCVCLVEIDRLESLQDLYGIESRERIVGAVVSLLRSTTRASDTLGCLLDQRLLILLPHTERSAATGVARRLLASVRALEFRGDGRSLRATLSIGLTERVEEVAFDALIGAATRALARAVELGGDRLSEFTPLGPIGASPSADPRPVRPSSSRRAATGQAPARPPALPDATQVPGETLEEKLAHVFALLGPGTAGRDLEGEVLQAIHGSLHEVRGRKLTAAEVEAEIHLLERRVGRLREMLDASEDELARMVEEKSLDPGMASVYRTVQGLDPGDRNYAQKKELLSVMYEANVELLKRLKQELGSGS
jgi:diguanylate cyclase (GGDEF)-like protein